MTNAEEPLRKAAGRRFGRLDEAGLRNYMRGWRLADNGRP